MPVLLGDKDDVVILLAGLSFVAGQEARFPLEHPALEWVVLVLGQPLEDHVQGVVSVQDSGCLPAGHRSLIRQQTILCHGDLVGVDDVVVFHQELAPDEAHHLGHLVAADDEGPAGDQAGAGGTQVLGPGTPH